MVPKSILLHARAGKLCPHLGASQAGRYIGRTADPSVGGPDQCAWPATIEGEEITLDHPNGLEHFTDYKNEALAGCLWPGDEATAKAFGMKFDPKFGGEFDEAKKAAEAAKAKAAEDAKKATEDEKKAAEEAKAAEKAAKSELTKSAAQAGEGKA